MNQTAKLFVMALKGSNDKFVMIAPNPEFPHLSRNDGELTEQEVKALLADKHGKSPSEIELLINEAKRTHERED